jgi:hypothetical protein
MKKYTVRAHTEAYETDSIDDAKSVMESMAITYQYACIINNETGSTVDHVAL